MQLRYVFSELGQGLRRNLSMHIAVVLTLFVSLTLVGLGLLLNQQADKAAEHWGSELQITVFLCNAETHAPRLRRRGDRRRRRQAIEKVVEENPEVAGYQLSSPRRRPSRRSRSLLGRRTLRAARSTRRPPPRTCPSPYWITLKDPEEYRRASRAPSSASTASPRSATCARLLEPIYSWLDVLQRARSGSPPFLVLAAPAAGRQHDPAGGVRAPQGDRHHAAGRRLDALHRAAVPARGAGDRADRRRAVGGALAAFMYFVHRRQADDPAPLHAWIDWPDAVQAAIGWIAILGPLLTLLPTLVLTRKYLKV